MKAKNHLAVAVKANALKHILADIYASGGKCLKTLEGLTPYEYICKVWTNEPERFRINPIHQMPRPDSLNRDDLCLVILTFSCSVLREQDKARYRVGYCCA